MICLFCALHYTTTAQDRLGFEDYYFTGDRTEKPLLIAKLFYQTAEDWYTEARYDYEERRSVSLAAGKKFEKKGDLSFDITPMAGLSIDQHTQASFEVNSTLQYRRLLFSSEAQYYISLSGSARPLFYSWNEASIKLDRFARVGLASQTTIHFSSGFQNEPGVFLSLSYGKWEMPLYIFNPAGSGETEVVIGLIGEFSTRTNKRNSFL